MSHLKSLKDKLSLIKDEERKLNNEIIDYEDFVQNDDNEKKYEKEILEANLILQENKEKGIQSVDKVTILSEDIAKKRREIIVLLSHLIIFQEKSAEIDDQIPNSVCDPLVTFDNNSSCEHALSPVMFYREKDLAKLEELTIRNQKIQEDYSILALKIKNAEKELEILLTERTSFMRLSNENLNLLCIYQNEKNTLYEKIKSSKERNKEKSDRTLSLKEFINK